MNIGGSWAQRQVVVLTAIKAAKEGKNIKLALALTAELKVRRHECSPHQLGQAWMFSIRKSTTRK